MVAFLWMLLEVGVLLAQRPANVMTMKSAPTQMTTEKTAPEKKTEKPVAQPVVTPPKPATSNSDAKTLIYLDHAETFSFDKALNPDAQLLKGNVCFRHEGALLYCDSAYFFEAANAFNAYGHVRIVQGDTLFVYGDVLYYDGNTQLARLRRNVRMNNREVTLETDSLNYDRAANVGYYFTGGKLYDASNTLTSRFGYYYPGSRMALFRGDVLMTNPKFVMDADTLKYFTETAVAEILGATHITYDEETRIYSERGQYDTHTEKSRLLLNSWVKHKDGQTLKGDSIFYDKKNGEGRAYSHVELNDSAKQMTLHGNFVYYKEEGEVALAYDSALLVEHSSPDTLYVNADTLYTHAEDSSKVVEAYYHVRVFRNDVQAVCDSASYNTRDSILNLMREPVAWSSNRQITGDTMRVFSLNGAAERMHVIGAAFLCEQLDSLHYNQLSGKDLIAHLAENELRQVDVRGNAESIFFPIDDDSVMIGLNVTASSYLTVYLQEGKIERIVLYPSPTGVLTPMEQITPDMLHMPGFSWQADLRPTCWQEVFARPQRQQQQAENQQRRRRSGHVEEDATAASPSDTKQTTDDTHRNSGFGRESSGTPIMGMGKGSSTLQKQGGQQ